MAEIASERTRKCMTGETSRAQDSLWHCGRRKFWERPADGQARSTTDAGLGELEAVEESQELIPVSDSPVTPIRDGFKDLHLGS